MQQRRINSLLESISNVVVGFGIALLSQLVIFPFYNIHIPLSSNLSITAWFTLISIVRSYALRRYYTSRPQK